MFISLQKVCSQLKIVTLYLNEVQSKMGQSQIYKGTITICEFDYNASFIDFSDRIELGIITEHTNS